MFKVLSNICSICNNTICKTSCQDYPQEAVNSLSLCANDNHNPVCKTSSCQDHQEKPFNPSPVCDNKTNNSVNSLYLNGSNNIMSKSMYIDPSSSTNDDTNSVALSSRENNINVSINANKQKQANNKHMGNSFGLSEKGLKLGNLNIGRLQILDPKFEDLKLQLNCNNKRNLDIFGLCETWLKDEQDNKLNIDGFKFERKDRSKNNVKTRGGGLLLYINNTFQYKRRFDFETETIESIWIEIKIPKSKSIFICSVYRSPDSLIEWIDNFEKEVEAVLANDDNEVFIMGDLNFNLLLNPPKRWLDFIEMYNLTQVISQPTRITENSSTLIDHIYTNRPDNISEVNVSSFSAWVTTSQLLLPENYLLICTINIIILS